MKKGYWFSIPVLAAIFAFCLWNSAAVTARTDHWQTQLRKAEALAGAGDWEGATAALQSSHEDWLSSQLWLHIVAEHDITDDADTMYYRAMAFAKTEESSEFQAELADLEAQLRLLAETAQLHIGNVF